VLARHLRDRDYLENSDIIDNMELEEIIIK
jgi:hypothetical protein